MERIIGRDAEISKLKAIATSDRSEFLALFGRRRVGKTFLVNQVFKDQFAEQSPGGAKGKKVEPHHTRRGSTNQSGYKSFRIANQTDR